MYLAELTTKDIETWTKSKATLVIPVGSTEQHGPTGLLGTDFLCPEIISKHAHEIAPSSILIGPTLTYGSAHNHLGFSGTLALRPQTMIMVLCDLLKSAHLHGFERTIFLNGHGGNIAPIQSALAEFHAASSFDINKPEISEMRTQLDNWWTYKEVKQYIDIAFSASDGVHATAAEISVTMTKFHHLIGNDPLSPRVGPPFSGFGSASDFAEKYPDGRVASDPALSTRKHGDKIVELASGALLDSIRS